MPAPRRRWRCRDSCAHSRRRRRTAGGSNLDPQVDADLDEFSLIDAALIEGLDGAQRKPFVQACWTDPDLHRRLGERADTFAEFVERVRRFQGRMDTLPDGTVIFGHGIWLAMLQWHLEGQGVTDTAGMRAFREFQLQLPMPNCAVFEVARHGSQPWRMERVPWRAESEYEQHG